MGVNCSVRLSAKTTWEYVHKVATALLGTPLHREDFSTGSGWAAYAPKQPSQFEPTYCPEYIDILVPLVAGNPASDLIEVSDRDGGYYRLWYGLESKSLYPKATAAKIALAEGICKFFGGRITYNDATGAARSFKAPAYIGAEDGKPWYRLQQALLDIKPLTQKDIERNQKHAAY